jgi:4-amino-4-deoxy-L-arabinose transferase-like glycosyltransferase
MSSTLISAPQLAVERNTESTSYCIPERSVNETTIATLIFVVGFAYLFLFRRYTSMEPDEGIILQGAQRILAGEVLYRDFFSFFTPGSYYFLALIFKIFGSSIIVARTTSVIAGAVASSITYLLSRRVCSRRTALVTAAIVTVTTLPYRFLVLHNWDSTLWACLAVYCSVRLIETSGRAWAFATGSFIALTFLFEQSKGAGLAFGLCAGLLAIHFFGTRFSTRASTFHLVIGLAWPFILTLAYFGAHQSFGLMLAGWFWPLRHYSLANHVPYGYQNWSEETRRTLFGSESWAVRVITVVALSPCFLIPLLPILAVGMLTYWVGQMVRRQAPERKANYYVLTTAALSGLLLSVVIGRADVIHFVYLFPLFALVLAWVIEGKDIPGHFYRKITSGITAYIAIAFVLFGMALLIRTVNADQNVTTRRGEIRVPGRDTVVHYVQAHVTPGERIVVYPYLPLYYYLTATYSATRYEYFQPGMHTAQQADEILSQLSSKRVRVILFEPGFVEKIPRSWPGTPLTAITHDAVADYILREYRSCKALQSPSEWRFLFMVRNDFPCP